MKQSTFDIVDRPSKVSTGAPLLALFGADGTSEQRVTYTRRGLVRNIGSSYGTLLAQELRDARGLVKDVTFGDAAQTKRSYTYNALTQVTDVTTYRAPPSLWASGTSPYVKPPALPASTTQLTLEHYGYQYDVMGDLTRADDWRTASEWPDTNRPVSRTWQYDSYSRLTQATYAYAGSSTWQAPFAAENASSTLLPRPAPHVSHSTRVTQENFTYDWLNNLVSNTDNSSSFFDRSIGTATFGTSGKPHRMTSSTNRATGSTRQGELAVAYDDVGQVTTMILQRNGTCLPTGSSCWSRYAYEWDEVGNLVRARRWDLTTTTERNTYGTAASVTGSHPPSSVIPHAEMRYQYDGGSRVVKTSTRRTSSTATESRYTVYPFSTLELRSVALTGSGAAQDYALNTDTTQIRLGAGPITGRVLYNATMPRTGASQVHLFLEFGDHLGSATFTIDHATSEVVEYVSYTAYGQAENDLRFSRWSNFREPYRYTGKEEDVEVGLNYHGARYYAPAMKRWMSADPVTVHSAGSDINPYSYGNGNPTSNVDPDGREIITLTTVVVVIVVSAIVAGGTNAAMQYNQTGRVYWTGKDGVWAAAGTGAVAGLVGCGVGAAAGIGASALLGAGTWGSIGAGAIGGAAGGAASGATSAAMSGGSGAEVARGALTGAVSGAVGGAAGVAAGSQSPGASTAFGGGMVGTGAGTGAGIGFNYAAWGDEPTWQSAGFAFGAAFAGTIASRSLSAGIKAASARNTAGRAAGEAAGESARRSSNATSRTMTERYTAELGARISALPDYRLAESTRPLVTCGGMGCWSSDGQVGMTVDGSVAVSPGIGHEGVGYAVELASDGVHAGPELVRRVFPDAGGDVTVHFYPDGPVTPADIRASQDVALDIGNFEVFVTLHPEKGLVGIGFGYGRDTNVSNVDVTWSTTDMK